MKLAVVGKGGTGKSTVSWLLANYLSNHNYVLAIDGDHNMDLSSNFGIEINSQTPMFYDAASQVRELAGMSKEGKWAEYLELDPLVLKLKPTPSILKQYIQKVDTNLDLIILGLGDENVMYTNKCSHGLSGHLKYLLPTLKTEQNQYLVLDSVAGSDMINYGLYFGMDVVCCVVEGHTNSIKVAKQLNQLSIEQGLNLKFIVNKYNSDNQLIQEFETEFADNIIGKLSLDTAITNFQYNKISQDTLDNLEFIIQNINKLETLSDEDKYKNLKQFEIKKRVVLQKNM